MAAAVVLVGWGVICALKILQADHRLQAGVRATQRARAETSTEDLAANRPGPDLAAAHADFQRARQLIGSSWVAPLRVLPFIGRQVRSATALSGAANQLTAAGQVALAKARGLLQAPHHTAAQRRDVVNRLTQTVAVFDRQLSHVDLGPERGLLGVLATKRATFASDLAKLRSGLGRADAATVALDDLLTGPRRYLVLAANNAETRDGSGMFLDVGTVSTDQGQLILGHFTPSSDLVLQQPLVPVTGDLAARWGFEHPAQDYRNLGLSPQFDANAALAAAVWEATTSQHIDGVMAVDVKALEGLLSVTGPVTAGGITFMPATVETVLLRDQYVGLQGGSANDARREELGVLASATFGAIQSPGISLPHLATQLTSAASGRHLLMWSADPRIEADWVAAGVGGRLGPADVLLGVNNQGANKLDPYLQVTSALTLTATGADTRVRVDVTLHNAPPPGLSKYAGGVTYKPPGTYVGSVALDFPKAAGQAQVIGQGAVIAAGSDYTADVLAVGVKLLPAESTTISYQFLLAGRHGSLRIDPSARLPPTTWRLPGGPTTDASTHTVTW